MAEWPTPRYPVTFLDKLAALDPAQRRGVAVVLRHVAETFAEVPDGKHTAHTLRLLAVTVARCQFAGYADEVVCLETPAFFFAVGQGYRNFTQTSDGEGVSLLDRALRNFVEAAAIDAAADPPLRDEEVQVVAGPVSVAGHLTIPENPRASWSSLTAAEAAGTAPAIGTSQRS